MTTYQPIPFSRIGNKCIYDTKDLDHYLNQTKNIKGAPAENAPSQRLGTKEAAAYLGIHQRQLERIRFVTGDSGLNK
mgnify:CR=1 FL=1|jgi:hypothetical protein